MNLRERKIKALGHVQIYEYPYQKTHNELTILITDQIRHTIVSQASQMMGYAVQMAPLISCEEKLREYEFKKD